MKVYSIFDDFDKSSIDILQDAGIEVVIRTAGIQRPNSCEMKNIMEQYDGIIIGTSQKISEDMFDNINREFIVATASVGIDHIKVPKEKKGIIKIVNAPNANITSVAQYILGCMIMCSRRMIEGNRLYHSGLTNKHLIHKPVELCGMTIGIVGAGRISQKLIEYVRIFGMNIMCWTKHPEYHRDIEQMGGTFVELGRLCEESDIISVNLPDVDDTKNLIDRQLIDRMKKTSIVISVSRKATVDIEYLIKKASDNDEMYVCLDLDVDSNIAEMLTQNDNICITPHIAGGTRESRIRLFRECCQNIVKDR